LSVAEEVKHDLVAAMKAGERVRVGALRMILSELQKAAKDGTSDELAVLRRERKRRLDAEQTYRDADRPELAEQELAEAALIDGYLPREIDDAVLHEIVRRAVEQAGAATAADIGRVMPLALAAVDGRADGRRVSAQVREALAG